MKELVNYNATLNLDNEKINLDPVIGSTNPLVPASDKINSGNSVNNSVIANDSATIKDISPSILDLKSEEINNVILPGSSTTKTSVFTNNVTSKSSISDTEIDILTGLKVNEAVIDNSKLDSLTNPSASQSQTLNNTEQPKENVTPAISESKTPDTSITSTENKTIAPAIEKLSVSVEETSPVTDKAAVTSESEDQAIAPFDTGSTTPVSSEKPVVTTESSSSVTGDAGSIASNTPAKNSDSAVVTNNNSGAIASEVSKSDTPVVTTAAATSDPAKTETEVTSATSDELAPAIEKPSVSVVETSPVTNKTAVTSESENKALASTSDITDSSQTPKNSINSTTADVTSTPAQDITQLTSESFIFNTGVFKVDETGQVGIDYLFDGGGYEGELGIFNLDEMEQFAQNSDAFITEAARRAVSNSNLGYVVINDVTEGARFNGALPYDINRDRGEYKGVKTFTMLPGDRFALILVPNGANLQQVANKSATGDDARPLFSLPMANPNGSFMTGQIADVTGVGNTFVMEDLRVDKAGTDSDYNDIIFQVRGATGSAVSIDSVINPKKEWRSTDLGKALIEYAKAYVTPENPKIGELVTDELYDSVFGNKDNQVDNNSKTEAIGSEVSKSDTLVVTAPATSDPPKNEANVTSTNSDAIAPATEKPSVSVEEAAPVTDKTAVTSERENQPLDSGSTASVSPPQPVVTTDSSSSVTGDAGAMASNTSPTNPDSVVVTDNNLGAIVSEVSKSDTPVTNTAVAKSDPAKTETDVTFTNSGESKSAIEKPSVFVVETSSIADKTAVTPESENKAISPIDSGSIAPVSAQQPVVTTESSSSVTGVGGAIVSDTPKTSDSAVVTDNNSGAIAVNPSSTTSPNSVTADNSVSNVTGDNGGAIAKATDGNTQPTVAETVASQEMDGITLIKEANPLVSTTQQPAVGNVLGENEEGGTIASTTQPTLQKPVATAKNSVNNWLYEVKQELTTLNNQEAQSLNHLQDVLTGINSGIKKQIDDFKTSIFATENSLNSQLQSLGSQLVNVDGELYNAGYNHWTTLSQIQNSTDAQISAASDKLSNVGNDMSDQVYNVWSKVSHSGDYMNDWVDSVESNLSSSGNYTNEWVDYAKNTVSNNGQFMYDWANYIWSDLSNTGNYLNQWVAYTNSTVSNVDKFMYDWVNYTWSQLSVKGFGNDVWDDYRALDSYRHKAMADASNQSNAFKSSKETVMSSLWNEYQIMDAYRHQEMSDAWNQYYNLAAYGKQGMDNAWNEYYALKGNKETVMNSLWSQYQNLDTYRHQVMGDAGYQLDALKKSKEAFMSQAWSQYHALENQRSQVMGDYLSQYQQLQNSKNSIIADAWKDYHALDVQRYQIMDDGRTKYNALKNSWSEWVDDSQAEIDVWAKILASENRWYKTSPADIALKNGLPLIGLIDSGFRVNNPDINASRITLGKDWVNGDSNPLLQPGEGDEHGTQMLEVIAATRNNGIGIDGINDKSPLWLGRAIGSGDWAQSLIEFVDAAKASGQPNAVVNLSFDLTQTNPDGSVTTRYELTSLERAALLYAQQNNVLVASSTGNQGTTMSALAQATKEFDNILVVGAAEGWQKADYSSYEEVDYANYGKGVDILAQGTASNGASGTSVATAKVTGAASLIWAANPSLNYTQVIDILKRTATELNASNWDAETGLGVLNISAAVHLAKATKPEVYTPPNIGVVQATLKNGNIPEVYWPEFYNLHHYYDLESKLEKSAWIDSDEITSTERATSEKQVFSIPYARSGLPRWLPGWVTGDAVSEAAANAAIELYKKTHPLPKHSRYEVREENHSYSKGSGWAKVSVTWGATKKLFIITNDALIEADRKAAEAKKKKEEAERKLAEEKKKKEEAERKLADAKKKEEDERRKAEELERKRQEEARKKQEAEQQAKGMIATARTNLEGAQAVAQSAVTNAQNTLKAEKARAQKLIDDARTALANADQSSQDAIEPAQQALEAAIEEANRIVASAEVVFAQTQAEAQKLIDDAQAALAAAEAQAQQILADAQAAYEAAAAEAAAAALAYQNAIAKSKAAEKDLADAKAALAKAEADLKQKTKEHQEAVATLERLQQEELERERQEQNRRKKGFFNRLSDSVKQFSKDISDNIKSNLDGVDVGAVVAALKKIPYVGTVVNGIEGLIALVQNDWKGVVKSGINGVLKIIPGGSAVPEKVVNILIDVGWGIISKDYKTALKDVLKELEVKDKVANTFVDVAWAMKDGDWKDVLSAGLSGAGFNNADKFVGIAWGVIKNGDYTNALKTGLEVAGLDKLGINSSQSQAFVNSAIALKDNQTSKVADELLSVAGTQFANSSWVRDLKDSNPNNDRAAVTQGLSAVGFKNVDQWVNMAWKVKDKDYLSAISTGFSLAGFTQGKDWVDMAWSLQQNDYLKALSTGFKVAGFAEGEHLGKAAVNLREGKYLDAFFEGIRLVPGVGDLINAFEAVGDGNFKGVANSLAKVATNPTLLKLLVS
ncbi:S8 family serine peptidase [Microcoleus sp. herbarium2]|uniref:S8 family serine peptidase n=1 Tax=Microcoleus sp. herbarium2 TaxID=3055433 RepID=UPI002FD0E092